MAIKGAVITATCIWMARHQYTDYGFVKRQEFCIHRYKLIDGAGKENVPKAEMFRRTTVTFDCVIEVFGRERILRLMYASSDMRWSLLDIR